MNSLLYSIGIYCGEMPLQNKSPVGTLTQIIFQSLEKGRGINAF
jgi:hypothetical protein